MCWEKYGDFEATRLIIDHADLLYLQQQKKGLLKSSINSLWLVARLYIALYRNSTNELKELTSINGITYADELEELKLIDGITYAYVLTKLNYSLSAEEANELFINNVSSDRIGLLIWCFGKQKLWNVLTNPLAARSMAFR